MSDSFVAKLVDETLALQKRGQDSLSSLELKISDYGLNFMKGSFIPQSQVLRFQSSIGTFDVPMNWSIFNHSHEATVLSQDHDPDLFFQVIKAAWKLPLEQILVMHADGFCYLVGLKKNEASHLHDLMHPQRWLKTA